jgi:hypothetical protein
MNYHTQAGLSPGLIFLCLGVAAIMVIPLLLKSSLNKNIDLPPVENKKKLSYAGIAQIFLIAFILFCGLLSLGRIYSPPPIWSIIAFALFVIVSVFKKKKQKI